MAPTNVKPPPPPSEREEEVIERRTLRDYYIILRERLWIALPLALLVSVGYGYWKMQDPPKYFARATMQFEKPDTIINTVAVVDQALRSDADLNTFIQILESGKLRTKVMESFTPDERKILSRAALSRSPPGTLASAVGPELGDVSFGSRSIRSMTPPCLAGPSRRSRAPSPKPPPASESWSSSAWPSASALSMTGSRALGTLSPSSAPTSSESFPISRP